MIFICFSFQDDKFLILLLLKQFPPHFVEVKRSPSKEEGFSQRDMLGKQHCFLTFLRYQGIGPQATSRGYKVIRSMRVWLARKVKAQFRHNYTGWQQAWGLWLLLDGKANSSESWRPRGLAFRISISRHPRLHNGSTIAAYLPAPSVDAQGRQKGVEDHVTGLYVDRRLPFPHRAKIPSWVHQSPERRN